MTEINQLMSGAERFVDARMKLNRVPNLRDLNDLAAYRFVYYKFNSRKSVVATCDYKLETRIFMNSLVEAFLYDLSIKQKSEK
ncbi:CLUMA_CG012514, isoform A [Clunio marinus]|uniref:CLUMA_CG012514, isoform A n=1 Tax=Clunio marinus TaxID=568069 RepID=A0A1J1II12_9DIPT|nr:CLUMA_CG012514, isoform A [Clunio marinus]